MTACILFSVGAFAQPPTTADKADYVSQWKTFANKAGWIIKHPRDWRIFSCTHCPDPTDPNVFVTLSNPATKGLVMIEHLIDKPPDQTVEQWLNYIKVTQNLNPRVSEEWITLSGIRALKFINRNLNSTESENLYVVHGSKTFAIHIDRSTPSYQHVSGCSQLLDSRADRE